MNQPSPSQRRVAPHQERPLRINQHIFLLTAIWTAMITLSLLINMKHNRDEAKEWARRQADMKYDDVLEQIRHLSQSAANGTAAGGEVTSQTMTRMLYAVGSLSFFNPEASASAMRVHVFSPQPLNSRNRPTPLERAGFERIMRAEPLVELETVEPVKGGKAPVFYQIRPLTLDQDCLRCHTAPGLKAGALYGGLSISIPLRAASAIEAGESALLVVGHVALWLAGLGGLWLIARSLRGRLHEREKSKKALQQERDFVSAVIDTAGTLVIVLDGAGRVVRFNRACELITGYAAAEVLDKKLWDLPLLPPGEKKATEGIFGDLTAHKPAGSAWAREHESFWLTRDGSKRLISWSVTTLGRGEGEIRHVVGIGIDITERRKIEHSLRASEEKFRYLFENCYDAIFIISAENGRIVDVNRAATMLMGIPRGGLIGLHHTKLHPPEEVEKYRVNFTTPRRSASPLMDCAVQRADGQRIPVEISVARFTLDGESFIQGVFRDVSERKRAEDDRQKLEEKIQHAQKLESLGVLAGGIAHDFNNLLMGVLGYADLALMELPPESPSRYSIQQIVTAAMRAADLTRQMLAYSGKGKFVIEHLDMTRLVEEMTHLMQVSISKKAVLRFNFAADLPPIEGDATQVRQVIMNLITNASDAIGEKSGVITIATGVMEVDRSYLQTTYMDDDLPEGFFVYVEVSDTGCGMDAETKARIFDPFFTTKFTGRGLGLAAVLGIVRGHHGGIKVYSEPGRGTTFKVLFPCKPQATGRSRTEAAADAGRWHGSGTVLVVDDEETVRAVSKMALELAGFQVLAAGDGREALEIFREKAGEIDLVLLDMTMPHLNGEETFREMRRVRQDARIILSSGYNEQEATNRFVGKGLAGFIQKPYRSRDLIEKVMALLNQSLAENPEKAAKSN